MPTPGRAGLALVLVAALWLAEARAQRPPEEAILPAEAHQAADTQALARVHAGQLRALYDDVRRCAPDVDFQPHGIGFWRPRGRPDMPPHLTLWVRLDTTPVGGPTLGARAGQALRRHARGLFTPLLAREAVRGDPRVGGYGLVLTWLPPSGGEGAPQAETLVLFVDKQAGTAFVGRSLPAETLLGGALKRMFAGQQETPVPPLPVTDAELAPAPC